MITQKQIKDDYAKTQHYGCWNELLLNNDAFTVGNLHLNEVMKIYAMECLKLTSENVICNENYININGIDVLNEFSVKQAITNENNIIK